MRKRCFAPPRKHRPNEAAPLSRVVPARWVAEFNIEQFISANRRTSDVFFTTTVKGARPIVAYMAHYDPFFVVNGIGSPSFGTLGTPLGITGPIA